MNTVLETQGLVKTYGRGPSAVHALRGIELTAEQGEFIGIMGPSGCGKSTLLYLLGALDRPTSGKVLWDGEDLATFGDTELSAFRNKYVGFVFQNYNLLPDKKAWENVALPLVYAGMKLKERKEKAHGLLAAVGLWERAEHYPAELSGGEEQRVAIARALANDPRVILADEPTGNLDSKSGDQVLDLLRSLNREKNLTVLVVTHNPRLGDYCHRIVTMEDGSLCQ